MRIAGERNGQHPETTMRSFPDLKVDSVYYHRTSTVSLLPCLDILSRHRAEDESRREQA